MTDPSVCSFCPACGASQADPKCPCGQCGFRWVGEPVRSAGDVAAWLLERLGDRASVHVRIPRDLPPVWRLTPRSLLHAIQRANLHATGLRAAGWRSHWPRCTVTVYRDPPAGPSRAVSLVMLCCERDMDLAIERIRELHAQFAETVVLIDTPEPPESLAALTSLPNVRVSARRLQGDFSAQRNAATCLATSPWVLHLDADERPSPELLQHLSIWIAFAERHGLSVLGLPRQNWVDGKLNEVYPDYQYRLHRCRETWTRKVHEVPTAFVRAWRRVWRLPADGPDVLRHELTRAGLTKKAEFYDSISEGGGQTDGIRQILGSDSAGETAGE